MVELLSTEGTTPMIIKIIAFVLQFATYSVKEKVCDWKPGNRWSLEAAIWWTTAVQPRLAWRLLGEKEACQRYGWYEGEFCTRCAG